MNPRPVLLAFVVGLASLGCGERQKDSFQPAPSSSADSIKIISIAPATGTPLHVGATAPFVVEVEYTLVSTESGTVSLVIQQGESGRMPLANETSVVQKGKGKVILRKDVSVPDTGALQVFTPLSPQGATRTAVVDTRSYAVVKG